MLPARDPARLAGRRFDVVVVGAGIHGACAAWEAARRGLSVALLDRGDFGAATSANSLKVIHGGLRYLQHADFPRVRTSALELLKTERAANPQWSAALDLIPLAQLYPQTAGWGAASRVLADGFLAYFGNFSNATLEGDTWYGYTELLFSF